MTINATAIILLSLYLAVARRQGHAATALSGTIQNDILKEYVARGTYIYPPRASLRIVTDIFAFCERELPNWNTISISGYHIREAGSTAVQEVAFTFANAIAYVQAAVDAGLDVDRFGQRLSFFFNAHNDFLEEVAKFRAARRLWARIMRDRFGATNARAQQLRFHTQTAGSTLTAQQPDNNIVRVALQALAAVMGGTQSLHCNGRDEALALPTEESARIALRTQQVHRRRNGRGQHRRSVRRRVRDRGPDQPHRGGRARAAGSHRRGGRHAGGHRARDHPARDPGVGVPGAAGDRQRRARGRRRQSIHDRRDRAHRDAGRSIRTSSRARWRASAPCARPGTPPRGGRRSTGSWRPRAAGRTSCRPSSTPSRHARPWGKSPTRSDRFSASTRRSMSDGPAGIRDRSGEDRRDVRRIPDPAPRIPAAFSRAPHHRLRDWRPVRAGGHRRQLRRLGGRDAVPGRRVRQREVGDGALDHAPGAAAGPHCRRAPPVQGARPAVVRRPRDAEGPGSGNRAHLPGADDRAEPGVHDRQPDRRDAAGPRPRDAAHGAPEGDRAPRRGERARTAEAGARLSAPAVGRAAAAGAHRDVARLRSRAGHRRRADDRTRRHHPGPDPRPAPVPPAADGAGPPPHHPRPRRRRRDGRSGGGHVCGTHRRGSAGADALCRSEAPLHARVDGVDSRRRAGDPAARDSGDGAAARRAAAGLLVHAAVPESIRALPEGGSRDDGVRIKALPPEGLDTTTKCYLYSDAVDPDVRVVGEA